MRKSLIQTKSFKHKTATTTKNIKRNKKYGKKKKSKFEIEIMNIKDKDLFELREFITFLFEKEGVEGLRGNEVPKDRFDLHFFFFFFLSDYHYQIYLY